jgi:mitochondrial intermediate peptidase
MRHSSSFFITKATARRRLQLPPTFLITAPGSQLPLFLLPPFQQQQKLYHYTTTTATTTTATNIHRGWIHMLSQQYTPYRQRRSYPTTTATTTVRHGGTDHRILRRRRSMPPEMPLPHYRQYHHHHYHHHHHFPPRNNNGWKRNDDTTTTTTTCHRAWLSQTTTITTTTTTTTTNSGLFSLPELQVPSDFAKLTQQAIQQCNTIRSSLAATVRHHHSSSPDDNDNHNNNHTIVVAVAAVVRTKEEASSILRQLDDISKIVCNVIDAAELCRNVHVSSTWRTAAHQAFLQLSDYLSILNTDTTLYDAAKLVSNTAMTTTTTDTDTSSSIWMQLSEEERRFTKLLQAEFERDGIHLSYEQHAMVRQVQHQIVQYESAFIQNMTQCRQVFTIQDPAAVLDVLPTTMLQQWGAIPPTTTTTAPNNNNTNNNAGASLPDPIVTVIQFGNTDAQILQTLLRFSTSSSLRRQIHSEYMTAVPENLMMLQELVQARHDLAVRQGFTSYVERNLLDKMIGASTHHVTQFLRTAQVQNQTAFTRDMTMLTQLKQQMEGNPNAVLEPWDVSFYSGIVKAQYHPDLQHTVAQYLTVSNSVHAMQVLVQRLFGIDMREETMTRLEQWDVHVVSDQQQQQYPEPTSKLQKFQFTAPDGRPLGTMYLDLHPREDKYNHAAQFTVRCGCALDDMGTATDNDDDYENNYQYPIVALVCNLSITSVLSHSEVETLFHEFGHALHSLLSRTTFQHMSGTRAAMDFVETPSHLLENYVWDAEFLPTLGRHHETGAPMPIELIQQLQQSRYLLAAIERQNQILFALFDQKLFGIPDPSIHSSTELFGALHRQFGIPYAEGTHWHSHFGHLVSYGAGYYGYLYSQVFSRDIWTHCLEGRSLNRTVGDQLWHKMLRHGGAKDPSVMLTDLLGRPPKVEFTS